jgi:hypothetical protein
MRWLRANGGGWDADACAEAAKGGHLRLLKWLRSKGCPWNEQTATNAALEGHLHVLSWALMNGAPSDAKAVRDALTKGLDEKYQNDAEKRTYLKSIAVLSAVLTRELRNTASAA